MSRKLVKRIYVQRRQFPDIDLWLEYGAIDSDDPKIHFYCNGSEGKPKERLLSIGVPTAIRVVKALNEIMESLVPLHEKEWEEYPDDQVGDY